MDERLQGGGGGFSCFSPGLNCRHIVHIIIKLFIGVLFKDVW